MLTDADFAAITDIAESNAKMAVDQGFDSDYRNNMNDTLWDAGYVCGETALVANRAFDAIIRAAGLTDPYAA